MKILSLAYYHFLMNFRDKKDFFLQILSPIVLVLILGTALSGNFSNNSGSMTVGLVVNENSEVASGFEQFMKEISDHESYNVRMYETVDDVRTDVQNGNIDSAVVFEDDHTAEVISNPNRAIDEEIVNQFLDIYNTYITLNRMNVENGNMITSVPNLVVENSINLDGRKPRAVDYYAVTMLAMYMMYGTGYGAYAIAQNYLEARGERIKCADTTFFEHFTGLALGSVVTMFIQGMAVVLFTKYVFDVNWGNSLFVIMFIILTFSLLAIGLGMFTTVIFKDKYKGIGILNALIPLMTFFSGGFMPTGSLGIMKSVQTFIPNYHFHNILFSYTFQGSQDSMHLSMMILWGMITVFFGGTLVMKERRVA